MVRFGFHVALEVAVAVFVLNMYLVQRITISAASAAVIQPTVQPTHFDSAPGLPDVNLVFDQVNQARITAGQQPLSRNADLTRLAQQKATDMQENAYYAHRSSNGTYFYEKARRSGFDFRYGCENLNLDFVLTSRVYVDSWLNSRAGHKECLLNTQVTEAGYAVAEIRPMAGENIVSYVIVAIHSTQIVPFQE